MKPPRTARRADDERRAEELERDGVAAFLDRWLALPLFANLAPDDAQLADRLENTAEGLASSLRLAGTGAQQSLWPQLAALPMPVLLVAGGLDTKFATIADQMAALIPRSTVAVVPDAGHVVHLERRRRLPRHAAPLARRHRMKAGRPPAAARRPAPDRWSSERRRRAAGGTSRRARRSAPDRSLRSGSGALAPRARAAAASPISAGRRQTTAATTTATNVATTRARYSHLVRRSPRRTASVRLPAARSVGMSRRLLTTRSAQAMNPARAPDDDAQPGDPLDTHVGRPDGGDKAEEHEHEQLAEAEIPVRPRAPCVPPRRGDAQHADHEQPPRRRGRQDEPGDGRNREGQEGRSLHRRRRRQPGSDEAHRSDPHSIGPAHAVGVVVGVVDPDLQRQADDEGQQRSPPRDRPVSGGAPDTERDRHDRPPATSAAVRRGSNGSSLRHHRDPVAPHGPA